MIKAAQAAEKAAKAEAKAEAKAAEKAAKAEAKAAKAEAKAAKAEAKAAEKAVKAAAKAVKAIAKAEAKATATAEGAITAIIVSDITHFFNKSKRNNNNAANKIRERILCVALSPSPEFLTDATHGPSWTKLRDEFIRILNVITPEPHTRVAVEQKAGRGHKFDFSAQFYNGDTLIATKKLEFKFGATSIKALPQFLSLTAKDAIMPGPKYHEHFYDHGLDAYIATDPEITATKPTKEEYCRIVYNTDSSCHPLFEQMRERRTIQTPAKNAVVNKSIKDYLAGHGASIDTAAFSKKVAESQTDKHFVLWSNGAFHYDHFAATEMTGFTYSHIKNDKVIVVNGPGCIYELLLRWRNDKGILMPAWQIGMKRA
jgi:hypothetical protein